MNSTSTLPDQHPAVDDVALGPTLLRLGTRLYRLQVEALGSLTRPLSVRQFRILERVESGISSQTELAELARRSAPTISKSADSLVRQGLLMRKQSSTDRRMIALSLTVDGYELLQEARRSIEELGVWLAMNLEINAPRLAERLDAFYKCSEVLLRAEGNARTTNGAATLEAPRG